MKPEVAQDLSKIKKIEEIDEHFRKLFENQAQSLDKKKIKNSLEISLDEQSKKDPKA